MFGLRLDPQKSEGSAGQSPTRKSVRLVTALLIAPVLMFLSAGCAQKQSPSVATIKPHGLVGAEGTRVAGQAYADVELEDDGQEAQQPPLIARKPLADDPNEPFSPNYGRVSSWQDDDASASDGDVAESGQLTGIVKPISYQNSMHR